METFGGGGGEDLPNSWRAPGKPGTSTRSEAMMPVDLRQGLGMKRSCVMRGTGPESKTNTRSEVMRPGLWDKH